MKKTSKIDFGYPGGAVLPIYDEIYDADIAHVLPRHEQGGIHAAEGYARITGKPGVVIVTSGPGATNIVTGLTDAMMDSLPLVVFTGQVATNVIGTDAFQEADIMGITTPITKYNYQVRNIEDIPRIVKEAFYIAQSGRPGPVLIDLPKNIVTGKVKFSEDVEIHLPGYQPTKKPNYLQIRKLTEAVSRAKKPVILAGAGILHGKATEELKQLCRTCKESRLSIHCWGWEDSRQITNFLSGWPECTDAMRPIWLLYEADLLINIGARFDDRLTGNLDKFAPYAIVAHVDIDPAEIGKNVPTNIPVVADAKEALKELIAQKGEQPQTEEWLDNH